MALTQDDFVSAVAKLNEMTRLQIVKWRPCDPIPKPFVPGFDRVKQAFEAVHEGRRLRVTQLVSAPNAFNPGYEVNKYVLDVRDQDGNSAFRFPDVAGIGDLFHSVQAQGVDIEGFIKKLVAG